MAPIKFVASQNTRFMFNNVHQKTVPFMK